MTAIHITIFGAPRIVRDGAAIMAERRKSLALLAYLAVMPGSHGRATLATLLWPDLDESAARGSLRHALVDLRQAIGAEWLATEGDEVALRVGAGLQADVRHFHALLAQVAAHSHPPQRPCDACLTGLTEAAARYTADFLAGFTLTDAGEFDAWQTFQTESLRLELAGALEKLATGLAGRQAYAAALPHARRWLALDPLHEPAHRLLVQIQAGAGDRAAAVRQYQACVKVLQAELGIAPEPETTALHAAIRGGDAGQLPVAFSPAAAPAPSHNLPADPTPFIGRAAELAQIAARLADPACRLLTILGPGGMGKTRLAIQAARGQADSFAHGVCFVDLAPLTSAEQLGETILRALRAPSAGAAEPGPQVVSYLADKQMLLVLDNYEQLLRGQESGDGGQESGGRGQESGNGAGLVVEILRAAPRVKLLVTSRARLNVRPEWLAPLEGLEIPSDQNLAGYSATALFLACARRIRADFQPTAADAERIVRICRLLDGIPLAIELAAAWLRTLPLAEIEAELAHGLDLLATTLRDLPSRHQSMTAAFDHSWRLLRPAERSILRQLSIFRGGFTRAAAAAVTGATVADLAGLVDASWLRVGPDGRFEVHELTRQYCAEKLATEHAREAGETPDQVRERHAGYFQAFAQDARGGFGAALTKTSRIAAEFDNCLVALEWHVAHIRADAVNEIAGMFGWYAYRLGWFAGLIRSLERSTRQLEAQVAVAPDDPRSPERSLLLGRLYTRIADSHLMTGAGPRTNFYLQRAQAYLAQRPVEDARWREARWFLERTLVFTKSSSGEQAEAIRLWEKLRAALDDDSLVLYPYTPEVKLRCRAETYWGQAGSTFGLGRYVEAQRLCETSIAISEQIGWAWGAAVPRRLLAMIAIQTGNYREAEDQGRTALRVAQSCGDQPLTAQAFNVLGMLYCTMGHHDQASACHRRALVIARSITHQSDIAQALCGLATIRLAQHQPIAARHLYEQSLAEFELGGTSSILGPALTQMGLGQAALAARDRPEARRRFLGVLAPGQSNAWQMAHAITGMAEVGLSEGRLASAVELLAFLQAWPPTPFAVRERAASLLAELEAELPAAEFAAAVARGRARPVDEVVAELAPVAEADRLSR